MSHQEIADRRKRMNQEGRLSLTVAMHAAPLLFGNKIANIITISAGSYQGICRLLQGTNISVRPLRAGKRRVIVFLYRREALREYLNLPECRKLLRETGYLVGREVQKEDLKKLLSRLARRVSFYHSGEISYPHEIGLFLGYPIEDVRGFLEKQGRDCLYSGYWKVYADVAGAKKLFLRFEDDRAQAVAEVIRGRRICEIAV